MNIIKIPFHNFSLRRLKGNRAERLMKTSVLLLFSVLLICVTPQDSMAQHRHSSAKKTATVKKTTKKTTSSRKKQSTTKKGTAKTTPEPETAEIKSLKSEKAKLQREISQREGQLRSNKADVGRRLKTLVILNGEIDAREKHIDKMQRDIDTLSHHITGLTHDLDSLQHDLDKAKARYVRSLRKIQSQHGNQNDLHFILSAKSFNEMYRRIRYLKEYGIYQRKKGEEIRERQAVVTGKRNTLEQKKRNRTVLLEQDKQEKEVLTGKRQEQQKVVQSLQSKQKEIQSALAEQRRKSAQLNKKIDTLIAIEIEKAKKRAADEAKKRAAEQARQKKLAEEAAARRRAAEAEAKRKAEEAAEARRRAAAAQAGSEAARQAENEARKAEAEADAAEKAAAKARQKAEKEEAIAFKMNSDDAKITGDFEHNRGRLPMPITGPYRVVSHFGQYNVEGLKNVTLDNKGINIQGRAGAKARSIFDGEVSAVFGFDGTMVVMVRHGEYISVYCNLSSVSVSRGQRISTRQVLGSVGEDNILQFQLRKGTAKLNPEAWVR